MGTETPLRSVVLKILSFSYVKLNNPLMGTEIHQHKCNSNNLKILG